MITKTTRALLATTLFAVAGIASAQVPNTMATGEATTKAGGQINPVDKSPKASAVNRAQVNGEARMANTTNKNKMNGVGEMTTTGPNGQPNMLPASEMVNGGARNRADVKAEARVEARTDSKKSKEAQ